MNEFLPKIESLKNKVLSSSGKLLTEESTKTAFILPLIAALGYDVFDPHEVIPEFTSDFGIKKGEKVDYAILINGDPIILIESKKDGEKLSTHNSQLFRYFSVTKSKFGILTNGSEYEFYSDLEKENIMDSNPFLKFNLKTITNSEILELKKFHKDIFDVDSVINSASELKYFSNLYEFIRREFTNPSDDFIKNIVYMFYDGRVTSKVTEKFKSLIPKVVEKYIDNEISKRLNLHKEDFIPDDRKEEDQVITTFEEVEAYSMIKTILSEVVDLNRISYKDSLSYNAIVLDGSTRKSICRLYFNKPTKWIAVMDQNKREVRTKVSSINDIISLKSELIFSTRILLNLEATNQVEI